MSLWTERTFLMEISMLTRALLVTVLTAVPASSLAQTGFADLIDHIHLAAPDQAKDATCRNQ